MFIGRAEIDKVLETIWSTAPDAPIRVVGTASSVLRGIELPAADVDLLLRERRDVDAWVSALASCDSVVEEPPRWIPDTQQYFARLQVDGVPVELSTVEAMAALDVLECVGAGPWTHFDYVERSWGMVPVVATELRLITELARGRLDRAGPIIQFLGSTPCDLDLLRRGLTHAVGRHAAEAVVADVLARHP